MAQKHLNCLGCFLCYNLGNTNMYSSNLPEWEKILKHGVCSDCGANLDFDDLCSDCTGTSDYVDNVLGT